MTKYVKNTLCGICNEVRRPISRSNGTITLYCPRCHRERAKRYRIANGDAKRERDRQYRAANAECINAKVRAIYKKNPAPFKASARSYRDRNPHKKKEYNLRLYGLTLAEFNSMLAAQNGCCAICGHEPGGTVKQRKLCVDHCHKTGKVRALLCGSCNIGMGLFGDDPERLIKAASYAMDHASNQSTTESASRPTSH